jgi:hypothetical protein
LKLLPERYNHTNASGDIIELDVRKGALYGISEVERGDAYLRELRVIADRTQRGLQSLAGNIIFMPSFSSHFLHVMPPLLWSSCYLYLYVCTTV